MVQNVFISRKNLNKGCGFPSFMLPESNTYLESKIQDSTSTPESKNRALEPTNSHHL